MKIKLMFILPWIVVALLGCEIIQRAGEPRYHALSFTGDEPTTVWNLNRYSLLFHSGPVSENPTAIMAEEGDLLYISTEKIEMYYRYNPKDGNILSFTYDPNAPYKTFLNGRLISLIIYDDPAVWEWIEDCKVHSLRHLRSLYFLEGDEESQNLDLLQKIANARPNIGLIFDESYDPLEIIALFTPTWLVTPELLDYNEDTISRLRKLKCLFYLTSEGTEFIEELTNLENLILFTEDDTNIFQLNRLNKLRSLSLFAYGGLSGLTTVNNRNRLRNLYLIGCEIDDIGPVCAFPKLIGLGLFNCEGVVDLSKLQTLSHLRWFSFPPNISQSDFSTFLSQHPGLKVIDLLGCDEINNLSPLDRLKEVQGLTLDIDVDDLSPLYQFTNLEVLVLDEDSFDDEVYENLQAALPNTQVASGGYCLGSGWLLLMIPFMAAGSAVAYHSKWRSSR